MTLQQDSSETGAAGERQEPSVSDSITLAALRAFDMRFGYSKLERMRDALEAVLPTRDQVTATLHDYDHGHQWYDDYNCPLYACAQIYPARADAVLALFTGSAS